MSMPAPRTTGTRRIKNCDFPRCNLLSVLQCITTSSAESDIATVSAPKNTTKGEQPMSDGTQELLKEELLDLENLSGDEEEEASFRGNFAISSYGADYNVDSLVKRMTTGAFYKPDFQREFVWTQKQASRFIESLLMGLPVPGIFVYRLENNKHLVIDGLQRLTTLERFYKGLFGTKEFVLQDVREPWENKSYRQLPEEDRLRLDDSIVHTTVFKQDHPDEDNQSVYEVFERINTGGLKLSPQEIRVCVSYVEDEKLSFVSLLRSLNENPNWRSIYGPKSARLKDQELILRFLAFNHNADNYKRPLRNFLDTFMARNKTLTEATKQQFTTEFDRTVEVAVQALGQKAFRPEKTLNVAVYDAVMVGLAKRIQKGPIADKSLLARRYETLLTDQSFIEAFKRSTADEQQIKTRLSKAIGQFDSVP